MIGVFFSIRSVGSLEIVPKRYIIDKWVSPIQLNTRLAWWIADWRYKLWIRYFAPDDIELRVGEYLPERGTTVEGFFTKTLKKPEHSDITITILPGWNMYDIDAYLVEKNIIQTGDFLRTATDRMDEYREKFGFLVGRENLEGFLYPDTYRVKKSATAHDIIVILLGEFQKKIGKSYSELGQDAYKKLILASIVEREERVDAVQPIVAWILEKRVREGIPMGADATVCTGYAKTQKQCTPSFIATIIWEKHPFNTRNKQGYPPTPIASVPLSSWNAAINPESSPYYYYLHDSEGVIHYGKTLDEHNANKQKYLQ